MSKQRFESIWDAIEPTPELARNMELRSNIITALTNYIEREKLTQAKAAKLFNVTQPRISDLKRGKVSLFSLDSLVNMLGAIGIELRMEPKVPERAREYA